QARRAHGFAAEQRYGRRLAKKEDASPGKRAPRYVPAAPAVYASRPSLTRRSRDAVGRAGSCFHARPNRTIEESTSSTSSGSRRGTARTTAPATATESA